MLTWGAGRSIHNGFGVVGSAVVLEGGRLKRYVQRKDARFKEPQLKIFSRLDLTTDQLRSPKSLSEAELSPEQDRMRALPPAKLTIKSIPTTNFRGENRI